TTLAVAQTAEDFGLDLVTSQDHPYNKTHLDAWTLISAVAALTNRVHIGTNVANLPLRTPTMLAKMAASLDVISGGRVELGIGAGTFWRGIRVYGGRADLEEMPFTAFKEGLAIIRGMWAASGQTFRFEGEVYDVPGAGAGPAPAHPIRIWVGGRGPKMLRLIGEQADGVMLSVSYVPYAQLKAVNEQIDAGARAAGRDPDAVRRLYNVMGVITPRETVDGFEGKSYSGTVQQWIDHLSMLVRDCCQDTFVFWPTEGDPVEQMKLFASEIAPGVKEAVQ
ncbi:MAG: LLM class flavin-dependent oxidoreductase, partial [Chloroflexi bacterium]